MWLRLALKPTIHKDSVWLLAILGLFLLSSCSPSDRAAADKLNTLSYAFHYRDIDSTEHYARQVLQMPGCHDDQRAEALNNLAFASIIRMDYDLAHQQLDSVIHLTDNQVELLVSYVQQMRLCQRRSRNREFHEYRERAMKCLSRIHEERGQLPLHVQRRSIYAESELAIVNSTYYYYVGLERQSVEAMQELNVDEVRRDTAQYLNYLYNVGAGGILTEGSAEEIEEEELGMLQRCLTISQRQDYPYFEAQAKEALAEHTSNIRLAEEALQLFSQYGDIYQIAGAYRTLASCYHAIGDDLAALDHLHMALADTIIQQAPDLVASISEQLSVAYAALGDKVRSDECRNRYLDLQEQTRQDREMEARAGLLDMAVTELNRMILAVVVTILLLVVLLCLFNWLNRRQKESSRLDDLLEEKTDELTLRRQRVRQSERLHLEQRAKVSLVNSVTPMIERILYEVAHLPEKSGASRDAGLSYIRELTDKINEYNDLLTLWIQLRQGKLSLHIESFPLGPIFDIVSRGKKNFGMKGIELTVVPTDATVKADRVLTLFMINTLADNALKFTDRGGTVTISAHELADSVEISVTDTGCGMSEHQLAHVFDAKPITDEKPQQASWKSQASHGFGLLNCRGIIEQYRKMSQLFSVCQLSAESEQGRGSRFYFRLPKGVVRLMAFVLWLVASGHPLDSASQTLMADNPVDLAHIYADSAYFCNVNGNYERTLQFADSCRKYFNQQYLAQHANGTQLLLRQGDLSTMAPEVQWYHDGIDVNYQIILDIRNECAVAALALHQWELYTYNNKVYTQLFKETSADNSLGDYCRTMQQSQANKRIAVILLTMLLMLIVPAYYVLYYRQRLYKRHRREAMQLASIEMTGDELRRSELEDGRLHVANAVLDNCLSALKHETMYYPSRIRQLVDSGDIASLAEVTHYYRDLYAILSEQAQLQVEQVKLHVRKMELYGQTVLGDENMLSYLFELLKSSDDVKVERTDDKYVVYSTPLSSDLSPFSTMLVRQILRDHGEATHRRGCGIRTDNNRIYITLPRYNGQL